MNASRSNLIRLPLTLIVAGLLCSCATVPETGRRQLLLTSPQQETELGLTEFQKLKKSTPVSKDPELNALARRVGERLAAVAPLPQAQWEFVVFEDDKTVNAFCLPGGKVGLYTGILPVTLTEGGLATVVSHEIAHAVARHGGERISEALLIQLGGVVMNEAMQKKSDTTRALWLGAYGLGSSLGVALPHSRAQELEADHLGLLYMARAGYDPHEAIEFWRRFANYNSKQGNRPPQFLSTHPVDATRIANLEQELPRALEEFRKSGQRGRVEGEIHGGGNRLVEQPRRRQPDDPTLAGLSPLFAQHQPEHPRDAQPGGQLRPSNQWTPGTRRYSGANAAMIGEKCSPRWFFWRIEDQNGAPCARL